MPYKNIEDRRAGGRRHYASHKELVRSKVRGYKAINRERIREENHRYKTSLPFITYTFFDDNLGTCVYVGSGRSNRPMDHKQRSSWWTPDLRLEIIEQPTQAHARRDEYDLMIELLPTHNTDGMLGLR